MANGALGDGCFHTLEGVFPVWTPPFTLPIVPSQSLRLRGAAPSGGGSRLRRETTVRFQDAVRRLGALAAVGSLVVACSGSATPAPTAAPTAAPGSPGASASAAAKGELPKPELTTLRLGTSAGTEMSQFAGVQAVAAKIFEKYGISATVSAFEGEAKAIGALQAGQIDVSFGGGGSALSSQLTDVPLVSLGISATILTDDLVCTPAIKTPADVKGKKIAISTFGGTAHGSGLLLLKSIKLSATDAVFAQVGGQTARIAAVKGGSVDCAVVDKVLQPDMLAAGLNIVAKVYEPPVPYGRSGMSVTKDFLKKNPNTALVALAAVLEGQNLIWTDTAGTIKRFAAHLQTDEAKAKPNVEDFLTVGNRSMMWKDEAFINAQKVIALVNPDIIDVKITDAFDRGPIQKLLDIGFYDKIGNPAKSA
jgi:ABC-type nitrate/sulfonate/bicarbonate transport system substrate-binding protein